MKQVAVRHIERAGAATIDQLGAFEVATAREPEDCTGRLERRTP